MLLNWHNIQYYRDLMAAIGDQHWDIAAFGPDFHAQQALDNDPLEQTDWQSITSS